MQITIALITINNLSQDSNISVGDRLWIWLLAWAILDAIVYVNACLLVPRMLLTGNIKRYFISISAILFLMVSCNVFFLFLFWQRGSSYRRTDFHCHLFFFKHLPDGGRHYSSVPV